VAGDVSSDAACRSRALGAHCTPAIYHWTQQLKKQPACGQTASLQTRCLLLGLRCMLSVDIGLTLGARVNSVVTVSEYCVQRRWRLGGPSPSHSVTVEPAALTDEYQTGGGASWRGRYLCRLGSMTSRCRVLCYCYILCTTVFSQTYAYYNSPFMPHTACCVVSLWYNVFMKACSRGLNAHAHAYIHTCVPQRHCL